MRSADLCASSIFDVDFLALEKLGVRGVLLDVDNTIVPPRRDRVDTTVGKHLLQVRLETKISRWALASNARRDLSSLAAELRMEAVQPRWLSAKPRKSFFRRALAILALEPHEVAMIGDKVLHDISPAARLGLRTVLVKPCWEDQWIDRALMRRQRERRRAGVREAWNRQRP